MFCKEFYFGEDIKTEDYYSAEKGYGFVNLAEVQGETNSRRQLMAGGWSLRATGRADYREAFISNNDGVFIKKKGHTLVYRVEVPSFGAYKITITTRAFEDIEDMTYYAGRRNFLDRGIELKSGMERTGVYYSFVSPYIPALESEAIEDRSLYISVTGANAGFSKIRIESAEVPTVFVAGDSTLTDQGALTPYFRRASCGGWAQALSLYLKDVSLCNQAHSGLTTNCFKDDGHLGTIENLIKKGDFLFLQFGHNDQKRRNLSAFGGYADNLRWYVDFARKKGATPIIVSPISRVPLEERGAYYSLLEDHAKACQLVAKELGAPFIDLHKISFEYWCSLGVEKAKEYFCNGDITHTNDFGAAWLVEQVAKELGKLKEFEGYLNGKTYGSLLPEDEKEFAPVEPAMGGMFDIEPPYVDIKGIPEYEGIRKAFKLALLDPCVMHLHPYDPMPRAQFFMIYFKALRINGKRPYEMKYSDIKKYEWDSAYIQAAIEEKLIDEETTPGGLFRPDEDLTGVELASLLVRGMKKADERKLSLEACFEEALALGLIDKEVEKEKPVNRAQCYISLARLSECLDTGDKALPSDAEIHPVG